MMLSVIHCSGKTELKIEARRPRLTVPWAFVLLVKIFNKAGWFSKIYSESRKWSRFYQAGFEPHVAGSSKNSMWLDLPRAPNLIGESSCALSQPTLLGCLQISEFGSRTFLIPSSTPKATIAI
jgi:hypothetical protein